MDKKAFLIEKFEKIRQIQCDIDEFTDADFLELTKDQDIPDDAQWFNISDFWDCPESPFGLCAYHKFFDRSWSGCVFCHQPYERK